MAEPIPTQLLIQANVAHTLKVESRDGDSVGEVYAFMVHKGSGRTTHAVLSLGGFLGMGRSFYPVPFPLLQFDPVRDVYVITIDRARTVMTFSGGSAVRQILAARSVIARDVYVITIDRRLLEGGPSWANNAPVFDQAYADRVASYYGSGSENLANG